MDDWGGGVTGTNDDATDEPFLRIQCAVNIRAIRKYTHHCAHFHESSCVCVPSNGILDVRMQYMKAREKNHEPK